MATIKVIELIGTSKQSWEDAASNAGDHTPIVRRSPFHIKTCPTQTPLKPARI